VTWAVWEGPLRDDGLSPSRVLRRLLFLDELDLVTRRFMLAEFGDFGWEPRSPSCSALSPLGREVFPFFLRAVIGSADEVALMRVLSYPTYWNVGTSGRKGEISLPAGLSYLRASARVAMHEFNAWYVRGLAARLLSEGETHGMVYAAAAAACKPGVCSFCDRAIVPLSQIDSGSRSRRSSDPAPVSIPCWDGCYHSIKRIRQGEEEGGPSSTASP
jgi:hypothetical protein